jgi:hypothetical protein
MGGRQRGHQSDQSKDLENERRCENKKTEMDAEKLAYFCCRGEKRLFRN